MRYLWMMVMACAVMLMAVLLIGSQEGESAGLVDLLLRIW
ncbi:hypothetical protein B8V81_1068 [Paenibacillus pasadenensis]|uniref:Uncharacterized protein n=1 Tax=Paenibacillus pasadenensis TaxID=217090 RepID=A0A2N5N938_9BACL|nr:hypothetical protein B8V81_1068 [Paenibacillus pasadenensis]